MLRAHVFERRIRAGDDRPVAGHGGPHQKVLSGAPRGADPWGVCGDCEIPERLARPEKLDLAVGVLPGECFSGSRSFGCFYRNGELQSCTAPGGGPAHHRASGRVSGGHPRADGRSLFRCFEWCDPSHASGNLANPQELHARDRRRTRCHGPNRGGHRRARLLQHQRTLRRNCRNHNRRRELLHAELCTQQREI